MLYLSSIYLYILEINSDWICIRKNGFWIWILSKFDNYLIDVISDTICGYPHSNSNLNNRFLKQLQVWILYYLFQIRSDYNLKVYCG